MKIRTIYFKSEDNKAVCGFWSKMLKVAPHKDFEDWKEIMCGNVRMGFLKLSEKTAGSNCVPVFEFDDSVLDGYVNNALDLGATLIEDGRNNPKLLSVVLRDPFGNEFEFSKFHD